MHASPNMGLGSIAGISFDHTLEVFTRSERNRIVCAVSASHEIAPICDVQDDSTVVTSLTARMVDDDIARCILRV